MTTLTESAPLPASNLRGRVLALALALALAITLLPATPADAHGSPYCGHSSVQEFDGTALWLVEYWSAENVLHDGRQVHFHYYIHHVFNGIWGWVAVHSAKKHCGTWH